MRPVVKNYLFKVHLSGESIPVDTSCRLPSSLTSESVFHITFVVYLLLVVRVVICIVK